MSERNRERVNACFGRHDLMREDHFRFPRKSGLPYGYFDNSQQYAERSLKALCVACILLVIAWAIWGN